MSTSQCAACNNKLVYIGKIPDGILFKCSYCGSKKIFIDDYILKKDEKGYGNAYRERINDTKIFELVDLFEKKLINSDNNLDLLDIGFGSGEFLVAMSKQKLSVSGLECDPITVKILSQEGFNVHLGELGGEMNLNNKYDLITLWDVVEHISDVEKAFSQLYSITKSKGKVFVLTPNANSLFDSFANIEKHLTFSKSQRIMNICLNRYHLHRFTAKGLKLLFERFGFTVEQVEFLKLFSLKADEYTDGFAPGILRWTNNTSFNKLISKSAMTMINLLHIRNKIFITATKD